MNKKESLKRCNNSICIKHCSSCLNIGFGNYDYFINVEKLIWYNKSTLLIGDLEDNTEIYSKSFMENQNLYKLINREL